MSDNSKERADAVWETDRQINDRRVARSLESLQVAWLINAVDFPYFAPVERTLSKMQSALRKRRDGADVDQENEH